MTSTASREWQDRHPPTPAVVRAFVRALWREWWLRENVGLSAWRRP